MACILFSGTCLWYWHVLQIQTKILQSLACCNDSFILHICCNMQASSCRCAWYVVCSLSTWHSKIRKLWLTALAARHHTCRHGCRLAESRLATVTSCFYTSTSLNIQTFHSDSACGSRESLMVQPGLPKSLTKKCGCVEQKSAIWLSYACRIHKHHLQIEQWMHHQFILAVNLFAHRDSLQCESHCSRPLCGKLSANQHSLCTLVNKSHGLRRPDTLLLHKCVPHLGTRRCWETGTFLSSLQQFRIMFKWAGDLQCSTCWAKAA